MLLLLIATILMLGMLDRAWRFGRLELLQLRAQNELLELRDSLQNAALTNPAVDPSSYLYSLCMDLLTLDDEDFSSSRFYETILRMCFGSTAPSGDAADDPDDGKVLLDLMEPRNATYRKIMQSFGACMLTLQKKQHPIGYPLMGLFYSTFKSFNVAKDFSPKDQGAQLEIKEALRSSHIRNSGLTRQPC